MLSVPFFYSVKDLIPIEPLDKCCPITVKRICAALDSRAHLLFPLSRTPSFSCGNVNQRARQLPSSDYLTMAICYFSRLLYTALSMARTFYVAGFQQHRYSVLELGNDALK